MKLFLIGLVTLILSGCAVDVSPGYGYYGYGYAPRTYYGGYVYPPHTYYNRGYVYHNTYGGYYNH